MQRGLNPAHMGGKPSRNTVSARLGGGMCQVSLPINGVIFGVKARFRSRDIIPNYYRVRLELASFGGER